MTAENAAPGSSHPSNAGTSRRCAILLMGRNSVTPWTIPRTPASNKVIRPPLTDPSACSADFDDHGPVSGTVELHEHQALPGPQPQTATMHRHRLARTQNGCLDVGRGVVVHAIVPPGPFGNHATQGVQYVLTHVRIGVLVDHDRGGSVRDVHHTETVCD